MSKQISMILPTFYALYITIVSVINNTFQYKQSKAYLLSPNSPILYFFPCLAYDFSIVIDQASLHYAYYLQLYSSSIE